MLVEFHFIYTISCIQYVTVHILHLHNVSIFLADDAAGCILKAFLDKRLLQFRWMIHLVEFLDRVVVNRLTKFAF